MVLLAVIGTVLVVTTIRRKKQVSEKIKYKDTFLYYFNCHSGKRKGKNGQQFLNILILKLLQSGILELETVLLILLKCYE